MDLSRVKASDNIDDKRKQKQPNRPLEIIDHSKDGQYLGDDIKLKPGQRYKEDPWNIA